MIPCPKCKRRTTHTKSTDFDPRENQYIVALVCSVCGHQRVGRSQRSGAGALERAMSEEAPHA